MREIKLRNSDTSWVPFLEFKDGIKVPSGTEIQVKYPTMKQQDIIDDFYNLAMKPALQRAAELSAGKDLPDEELKKINAECTLFIEPKSFREYKRKTIKFCLTGIRNPDIEVPVKNGEVEDTFFESLVADTEQADLLFLSIEDAIKFTQSDKKK